MKLIFMGTPDFSVLALNALIEAGHEICAVYTQPPRPAGRGQKEQKSTVHLFAESHGIEVRTPQTLKGEADQQAFAALKADAAVVAAYGLLLPMPILDACLCLNIHASLLPRWRGAAPIQRTIEAGDSQSGITIMRMDEGLDTGDMLLWDTVDIDFETTGGKLYDALSAMGARLIVEALAGLDSLKPVPQSEKGVTYAQKIKKEEGLIDWKMDVLPLERKIRAFNPFPGAYFLHNGEKIKILAASCEVGPHDFGVGEVVDHKLGISCKNGIVRPTQIQRQGKKAMSVEEFLRGYKVAVGTQVG